MNPSSRAFPELAHRLDGLTVSTGTKLSRSLVRALRSRRVVAQTLLNGVAVGCMELRVAGMDDGAIMHFFGALVEETGRACGADRPSLVSGQLRWMPVRDRVLELVSAALSVAPAEPFLAMDHANGPR